MLDVMDQEESDVLLAHLRRRRGLLIEHIARSLSEADRIAAERAQKAWAKADIEITFEDDDGK